MGRGHGASRGLPNRSFTNELPDFSSSIASVRVAAFFKPRPTGLLLKKTGVYSTKCNTGTEIRKFVVEARIVPPIRGSTHHGNGAFLASQAAPARTHQTRRARRRRSLSQHPFGNELLNPFENDVGDERHRRAQDGPVHDLVDVHGAQAAEENRSQAARVDGRCDGGDADGAD